MMRASEWAILAMAEGKEGTAKDAEVVRES
jgi:hypothetical protein